MCLTLCLSPSLKTVQDQWLWSQECFSGPTKAQQDVSQPVQLNPQPAEELRLPEDSTVTWLYTEMSQQCHPGPSTLLLHREASHQGHLAWGKMLPQTREGHLAWEKMLLPTKGSSKVSVPALTQPLKIWQSFSLGRTQGSGHLCLSALLDAPEILMSAGVETENHIQFHFLFLSLQHFGKNVL